MSEKVNLAEGQEYGLRGGVTITVYPASLEQIMEVTKQIEKLGKSQKLDAQVKLFADIIYDLIHEDNKDLKKEDLVKCLSIQASIQILQTAMGGMNPFAQVAI